MADEPTARRRLADAFLAGDAHAMLDELEPGAVFHSPVADYEGAERIGAVLNAVTEVVCGPRATRLVEGAQETLLAFDAELGGRRGEGFLLAVGAQEGPVSELTLMVRPLATLLDAVDRMRVLLTDPGPGLTEQSDLPGGGTKRFEGADHGAGVSFFLAHTPPGRGPDLHRHPYEETFIVHEGRLTFTVDGQEIEAEAGQIVIAPPGSPHKFVNAGDQTAHLTNIHPRPRMTQEDLE
jgi:quercetin dioxygenase-like cupin family protein